MLNGRLSKVGNLRKIRWLCEWLVTQGAALRIFPFSAVLGTGTFTPDTTCPANKRGRFSVSLSFDNSIAYRPACEYRVHIASTSNLITKI